MKKTYIAPSVEIQNTDMFQMIAESISLGTGEGSHEADVREQAWDIWSSAEDIDDEE